MEFGCRNGSAIAVKVVIDPMKSMNILDLEF